MVKIQQMLSQMVSVFYPIFCMQSIPYNKQKIFRDILTVWGRIVIAVFKRCTGEKYAPLIQYHFSLLFKSNISKQK